MSICSEYFGKITVVCGPMRSGKSEELIRIATKHQIAGHNYIIFKPKKDTRDGAAVLSRSGSSIEDSVCQIEKLSDAVSFLKSNDINNFGLIAIDEFHFFDDEESWTDFFLYIASHNIDVVICGLDIDHLGNPVKGLSFAMAISDEVLKLKAICCDSKKDHATMTIMKKYSDNTRAVGGDDIYEPLSKGAWYKKMLDNKEFELRMESYK